MGVDVFAWMKAAGRHTLSALERTRLFLEPVSRRVFGPLASSANLRSGEFQGFEAEADAVIALQTTQRAQKLVRTAVVVVVALLLWSAWAKVDEVTKGEGKVIPSRQLQVIQSFDGGVVSEILVKEGQVVETGQLLLKIDVTRATSGVRESAATAYSLRAKQARLQALSNGTPFEPPEAAPGDLEQQHVNDEERSLYESRRAELRALVDIAEHQLAQRQQELGEMRAKRDSAQRSLELSQQELTKTRPLLATGAVSEVEILRLERDVSRSRGEVDQANALMARVSAAISESQRKIQETELSFRNESRKELAEVLGKLNSINEGSVALHDKVAKGQVKSPVRGRVQRLLANTVGGVVQPGKDILEIVPLDDTLVLEARVAPKDIGFIRPGQKAVVKLTAYDYSIYGGLDALVEDISPDTTTDERGNSYYVVKVRTVKPAMRDKLPIIPGMTAEVDVLTGRKTVLSYMLQPVLKAHDNAFRER